MANLLFSLYIRLDWWRAHHKYAVVYCWNIRWLVSNFIFIWANWANKIIWFTSCRGALSSLLTIFFEVGILVGYVFGTYIDYSQSPMVSLVFPFIFICCFLVFPSTPQYLLRVGKIERAEKSLKFYRNYKKGGENDTFHLEFEKLKSIAKYNNDGEPIQFSDFRKTNELKIISKNYYKKKQISSNVRR